MLRRLRLPIVFILTALAVVLSSRPAPAQRLTAEEVRLLGTNSGLYSGTASPEGSVLANQGSLYLQISGGNGFLWFKKTGNATTSTLWVRLSVCTTSNDTRILFNDSGDCAGDADLTWDKTTNTLAATNISGTYVGTWNGNTVSVAKGGTGITSGTSGGIPAFTAAGTIASSGALTANLPVIGGGAGVAPTVGTRSGNTTQFATVTGSKTSGNCLEWDASGNIVDAASGDPCGAGAGGTVDVDPAGALDGDGSGGSPLAVRVDGSTIQINGSNELEAIGGGGGGVGSVRQIFPPCQTGTVATGTTTIPLDDTVPQNTEGDEYMTCTVDPDSATNDLQIDVWVAMSNSATDRWNTVAVFQDSTASAIGTCPVVYMNTAHGAVVVTCRITLAPGGTAASTTFKVRAGANAAGTTTFNGFNSTQLYGGSLRSSITVTEIVR